MAGQRQDEAGRADRLQFHHLGDLDPTDLPLHPAAPISFFASLPVIPGRCASIEPGISRFRARDFVAPRNDGERRWKHAHFRVLAQWII
ncbi:hypothetical protein E4K66_31250 [Bradyrhizobium frederickii]|uniref:Uncharacterized protein n=1 Tax=Bradyrhizobium frederickii TaxID=2560054 RepID=A0A4Y9KVI9_9BRAD|nr:hypothetical protein E4K66_31250 [Bradyrhizobium frederickii]